MIPVNLYRELVNSFLFLEKQLKDLSKIKDEREKRLRFKMKCQRCGEEHASSYIFCKDCEEEFLESSDDLETKFEALERSIAEDPFKRNKVA